MTVELTGSDLDHIYERYAGGETLKALAGYVGINRSYLAKKLKQRGFTLRSRGGWCRHPEPHVAALYERYAAGESCGSIAASLGVQECGVHMLFKRHGYHLRTRSEAQGSRFSRPGERARLQPLLAATRERNATGRGYLEDDVRAALGEGTPQKAIGPYNVDIAVSPVAVEIQGQSPSGDYLTHMRQRAKYLGDWGWHLYIIRTPGARPISPRVVRDLKSFLDRTRREPALPREYRVVRGTGHLIATGRLDADDISFVLPHIGRCGRACGHPLIGD